MLMGKIDEIGIDVVGIKLGGWEDVDGVNFTVQVQRPL